jgi:hypothetical protein
MTILIQEDTIVSAWLRAVDHLLRSPRHEDFNVMLEMESPTSFNAGDRGVGGRVDRFLTGHGVQALHTVANTIFPADLYRRYGASGVFDHYPEAVYPRLKKCRKNSWGTYVHRMVRRTAADGTVVNPLRNVISRLQAEVNGGGNAKRARYELNMVDPFLDLSTSDPTLPGDAKAMGAPCLSHLSFKLRDGAVALTAFYRSHYYVERALGNLLGLSNLMRFVAREAGLEPGVLTCISSMAQIDCGQNWNLSEVERLLGECKDLLAASTPVAGPVETVNTA